MSVWIEVKRRFSCEIFIQFLALLLPLVLSPLAISHHKESRCAWVMLVVALYWLLEPIPISVTALLPVVLFPLLGVVSSAEICQNYMRETFMMFIGGLTMAIAVEDCKLHERIALKVLLLVGSDLKRLMLGFMLVTMFLSMWVSNTATTAMLVPIVDAIIDKISTIRDTNDIPMQETCSLSESKQVIEPECEITATMERESPSTLKVALLLSVCYAANIGGTGTLTGTGPNLVFKGMLEELHPGSDEITFATWMMYNVPGMLICIFLSWLYLWLVYVRFSKVKHNLASNAAIRRVISSRYEKLGSMTFHEGSVLVLFVILVFLWIFRDPKFVNGWASAIGSSVKVGDSVPAIAICFLLFYLPSDIRDFRSKRLLDWKTAQAKLPWGIILLFGGGFALANGAQNSGLSDLLSVKLSSLDVLPPAAIVAVICFMTATLTEIASNTTTATLLLPVLSQMAISIGVNPLSLMLPVTVVCSYAFMLPVATAPNAIAFESANMKTIDMAKPGFIMNLVCCGVQLLMINTLGVVMFDLNTFPSWVNRNESAAVFPNAITMPELNTTLVSNDTLIF